MLSRMTSKVWVLEMSGFASTHISCASFGLGWSRAGSFAFCFCGREPLFTVLVRRFSPRNSDDLLVLRRSRRSSECFLCGLSAWFLMRSTLGVWDGATARNQFWSLKRLFSSLLQFTCWEDEFSVKFTNSGRQTISINPKMMSRNWRRLLIRECLCKWTAKR